MSEEELLTGPLEPTNEWYAVAKIAGIKLCQAYRRQYGVDFISVMPINLYGPGDSYHPDNSHVVAALIRRLHQSKQDGAATVAVWGTGTPRREFLFDCHAFKRNRQEECVQMPVKIARSTPRPSFGLPELLVASHISRLASRDAAKSLLSTLVFRSHLGNVV
jgi:hypothetical protein